jgi:Fe2+ transport system protein FeoA
MHKLSLCKEGDEVTVQAIKGSGAFRKRMLEMGVLKGSRIRIVKYAPLKDPLELTIKNYHLALRVEEAENVYIDEGEKKSGCLIPDS